MSAADTLYLHLNGIRVGRLTRSAGGDMRFEYSGEWLEHPARRPISLSLPLSARAHAGERVYNFFDNLLPDNQQIRARLQRRFRLASDRPFDLLRSIGRDCVGAIQLTEEEVVPEEPLRCKALKEGEIAALLRQYETAPLGIAEDTDDFRISIAGAQEETADQVPAAIDAVAGRLPKGFPEHIAGPVFQGMRECRDILGKGFENVDDG